jgi:phospholipase C
MPAHGSIDHVVIIVKENHTFDNYFGRFPGANGDAHLANAANPPPKDPDHKHQTWMARAGATEFKVQYGRKDIAPYFRLAEQFTLCDNYFSEVAGPSTPNHLMLICADSPFINNPTNHYRPAPSESHAMPSLPKRLEAKRLTWANYQGYAFEYVADLKGNKASYQSDQFIKDAAAGKLANVSWLYGEGGNFSEHPKQNVTDGANWTAKQIEAIVSGGLWKQTAVIITWDDWGGWYDHVAPPEVEKWNGPASDNPDDRHLDFKGQQFRYGSRVPCIVVSPYAKKAHISHQLNSHVSVIKFCTDIFKLSPLHLRATQSNGLSDCFDFSQAALPPPKLQ